MTSDQHYPNAPITEAVVDIQVATAATSDALEQAYAGEEASYPVIEKLNTATLQGVEDLSYNHISVRPVFSVRATYKYTGKIKPRQFPLDE